MSSRHSLFLVLTLTLLVSAAFAAKKDVEAAALINHAKQLSDIRAEGAPAFRLKMSFKIIKEDGSVLEGSHTEVWVSKTQLRRETVLGDFRETQVVAGRKRWTLNSSTAAPEYLFDFLRVTDIGRFQPEVWKPEKVEDRELKGLRMRCLEVNYSNRWGSKPALCFDKVSGTIAADIGPLGTRTGESVCFYADYQKFGDRVLARSYECDKDKHLILEARVVELAAAPATDPTFFTPPDGAKESVNCLSPINHPTAVYDPNPEPPRTSGGRTLGGRTLVVLNIVVGTDGKPHDLRVTSAPNRDFDEAALEAVRQWTFKPATCDGEPVETQVAVEVNFP
jgi:TonB family protein